ncbi:peptide chain release factor N(5)-glutamine methyltransferase [bacterium]|nr:peptide chain release factor N(5)-glutamine methyltransferase [bacterium]
MLITDIVKILTDAGIEEKEANVEVKLFLEHFANYGVADIIMGKKLTQDKLKIVEEKAKYRASTRQPIQYILGEADFMGEKFIVNPSVLIPRDETEILVRKAIEIIQKEGFKNILDMCTGSGCIACMIAKNTSATVIGSDISVEAIEVAFKNMEKMGLYNRALFRKSDLFSMIREDEKFDMIVSNPPYIPISEKKSIQKEVTYEPDLALYTKDEKGLEFYEKIIAQAPKYLNAGGYLLFELGIGESHDVAELMDNAGFKSIQVIKDLANIDRVILGKLI